MCAPFPATGFPELQVPWGWGGWLFPGFSQSLSPRSPPSHALTALPDSLIQSVHSVHVTLCCPRSDSGSLEAPSLGAWGWKGTPGCPR